MNIVHETYYDKSIIRNYVEYLDFEVPEDFPLEHMQLNVFVVMLSYPELIEEFKQIVKNFRETKDQSGLERAIEQAIDNIENFNDPRKIGKTIKNDIGLNRINTLLLINKGNPALRIPENLDINGFPIENIPISLLAIILKTENLKTDFDEVIKRYKYIIRTGDTWSADVILDEFIKKSKRIIEKNKHNLNTVNHVSNKASIMNLNTLIPDLPENFPSGLTINSEMFDFIQSNQLYTDRLNKIITDFRSGVLPFENVYAEFNKLKDAVSHNKQFKNLQIEKGKIIPNPRGPKKRVKQDVNMQQQQSQNMNINTNYNPTTGMYYNSSTGLYYNPTTGIYYNPNTGMYYNPNTGVYYNTNTSMYYNPNNGMYYNPNNGMYYNPNNGIYYNSNIPNKSNQKATNTNKSNQKATNIDIDDEFVLNDDIMWNNNENPIIDENVFETRKHSPELDVEESNKKAKLDETNIDELLDFVNDDDYDFIGGRKSRKGKRKGKHRTTKKQKHKTQKYRKYRK